MYVKYVDMYMKNTVFRGVQGVFRFDNSVWQAVDAEGNPIQGIQVSSGYSDVQSTNINGNFSFYGRSTPTTYVVLTFEDKDGADNGGIFVKRAVEVLVNEKTPGSEMGNFSGTYFASDVEVVMLKKEDELDPDSGLIPLNASAEDIPEEEL